MIVIDVTNEHGVYIQTGEMHFEKPKKYSDLRKKHSCKTFADGTRGVKATSVNIRAKPLFQQLANMSTYEGSNSKQCPCSGEHPPRWFFQYMDKVMYSKMKMFMCQNLKDRVINMYLGYCESCPLVKILG